MATKQRVVILGGGIHGVSTAYQLALKGVPSLIIEKTSIAAAASGKAGGFLARNWGSGPTVQLHERGFDMHKQLATTLGVESYRQVDTLNVDGNHKGANVASWLDRKVTSSLMDRDTAQVTPLELTQKMLAAAQKQCEGVEVLIDSAEGLQVEGDKVTGVRTKSSGVISASQVVICLGPWSGVAVEDWLGLSLPMQGVKSTSLVYADLDSVRQEPYACFCAEDPNHCHLELYPRPDGSLYVCGLGGSDYVSGDRLRAGGDCESASLVGPDPSRVEAASRSLRGMAGWADREPDVSQACMRPCLPDAQPAMGVVPGVGGVYISAGHNCWGILWAPVCGLLMAELLAGGQSSVDLRAFSPGRYMQQAGKRGRQRGQAQVGEQW
ncbi:FAD dependent oxidoreductase [Ochromonadaceae sp. CCMP2298]|nr:FAD dependent oxidoreductase [Ochromonadaceae sp. CCMP2298]KAJ1439726.1 FAD dependent oxidoreductase [Ochromonadaceae sp. CCMP2298]